MKILVMGRTDLCIYRLRLQLSNYQSKLKMVTKDNNLAQRLEGKIFFTEALYVCTLKQISGIARPSFNVDELELQH